MNFDFKLNCYILYNVIAGGSGIFRKNPRKNGPEDHGSEYRAKVGVANSCLLILYCLMLNGLNEGFFYCRKQKEI